MNNLENTKTASRHTEERKNWKRVKLGEIASFQSGGTPSRTHSEFFEGSIPWITTVALNGRSISEANAVEFLSESALEKSAAKLVPANSIMIGTRVGVGKVAINLTPMATNQDIVSLTKIDEKIWHKPYLLKSLLSFAPYFQSQARGATIKGIKIDTLAGVEIPLPPLEEQRRIAGTLDKVRGLIDLRERELAKFDELVKCRFCARIFQTWRIAA